MLIVGIDPGKNGGVAIIQQGNSQLAGFDNEIIVRVFPMPIMTVKDKEIVDGFGLYHLLLPYVYTDPINPPEHSHAFVEEQQAMSRFDPVKKVTIAQGAVSTFTLGRAYEAAELVVRILKIPLEPHIRPKEWQKYFGIVGKGKDTKAQSVEIASRLFPSVQFKTPRGRLLDGLSDAVLIAEYGRRKLLGATNAKESGNRRVSEPQEDGTPVRRGSKRHSRG